MKKRLIPLILILTLMLSVFATENGFAAAATVSLSGGGSYERGDSFYITLTYSGDTYGAATARLTYDSSILEFQSCSGAESYGSGGTVTVTMSNGSGTSSLSCRLRFTAKATGSTYVTATTSDVYNLDMEELSAQTKSVKVTVNNTAPSASTNANLASLQVSGGTLSPAFSAGTTSYTVRVAHDVTVCTISARAADSGATFQVTGSKNLSVGDNIRSVIVTAESGKTKTYTIHIIRAGADGSTESKDSEDGQEDEQEDTQQDIIVSIGEKEYLLVEDLTEVSIPQGFSLCPVSYKEYQVVGIRNGEDDVVLCLLEDLETGEQKWFFYEEEDESFSQSRRFTPEQIIAYTSDRLVYQNTDMTAGEGDTETGFWERIGSTGFLVLCLGITAGLLVIFIIILLLRKKRSHR